MTLLQVLGHAFGVSTCLVGKSFTPARSRAPETVQYYIFRSSSPFYHFSAPLYYQVMIFAGEARPVSHMFVSPVSRPSPHLYPTHTKRPSPCMRASPCRGPARRKSLPLPSPHWLLPTSNWPSVFSWRGPVARQPIKSFSRCLHSSLPQPRLSPLDCELPAFTKRANMLDLEVQQNNRSNQDVLVYRPPSRR